MTTQTLSAKKDHYNLKNYEEVYNSFQWSQVEQNFSWHTTGLVNIAHEAIDRHAEVIDEDVDPTEALRDLRDAAAQPLAVARIHRGPVEIPLPRPLQHLLDERRLGSAQGRHGVASSKKPRHQLRPQTATAAGNKRDVSDEGA